ncbi:MAG: Methionyl-tRNA formyltransferase [Patescibacteria group bacterium]|jgi:methionyl-tRNA formyltransferase|nr:Methionyl-tRNA formyltransferase [Patescibacteria group bacterium]
MQKNNLKFAYFGTSNFSVLILDELKSKGFVPSLIVTTEDKPKGRKLIMSPSEVKIWAEKEGIDFIQPKSLKTDEAYLKLSTLNFELFIVASYGKIIPQNILDLPMYKTLNVHPSLLPKLRGASPIQSAILGETETGVTIMRLDAEMDHGPIIAQQKITIVDWPPYAENLEEISAQTGAELLANVLPGWIEGKVIEKEQNHSQATYCKKIQKSDGELNLNDSPDVNLRKIRAHHVWPGAFFMDGNKRIIVKGAHIENNELVLDRVIPEGKKEMGYKDYLNGKKS